MVVSPYFRGAKFTWVKYHHHLVLLSVSVALLMVHASLVGLSIPYSWLFIVSRKFPFANCEVHLRGRGISYTVIFLVKDFKRVPGWLGWSM